MRSALMFTVVALVVCTTAIHAMGSSGPAWAAPSAMAVKRVSNIPDTRLQPTLLSNLDCTELTYRLVGDHDMRSGCFTPTAFGMLDSDSEMAIFNGTDEGLPLSAYSPHQVLVPWPKALNLVTLDAVDTGGSYVGMYKNPLSALRDQRNLTGRLTGKRLERPPDISLKGPSGQPLIINPQTMAFSDGGSWLVAETLNGSFIRINLASLDELAFAPAFGAQGSPGALFKSQVAISGDGRYVAIGNDAAGSLKVYDLTGCGGGTCPAHDYMPFLGQRIGGLRKIRHIRFISDGLLSFEAITEGGQDGVYELAPTASIGSLTDYLGLGDSYTSGEGAFDYLSGTDTRNNTCHLSANSYPLLLTRDLFSAAGGHSVACSGAVINDIGSTSGNYHGQAQDGHSWDELQRSEPAALDPIVSGFLPGYVAQHRFMANWQPRIATISIGGNDIGFGDILERCVVPRLSRHWSDETCYNTYESRQEVIGLVDRTVPRWIALYRQLQAESPGSTIYALGYPSVASDTGKCPPSVNLGKSELEFAEELIRYLDGSIQKAATSAGVPYVDISKALDGHRLCEASSAAVAVNGLTAGNDFGISGIGLLGRESYHPNLLGHQLIEQAILRQTNDLSGRPGSEIGVLDTGNLLDAPRTGRTINRLVRDDVASRLALPGQNILVRVDGAHDGLLPGNGYAIRLDGPDGAALSNLVSDPEDSVTGPVEIPDDTTPGIHTIDVIGPSQDGSQIDVTQPIYVPGEPDNSGVMDPVGTNDASGSMSSSALTISANQATGTHSPGRILGANLTALATRQEPVRLLARSTGRLPLPAHGIAGKGIEPVRFAAILVFCAALTAFGYCRRRIVKSLWNYFGRRCNNQSGNDYGNRGWCYTIVIMRKFGVVVFCVVFFVSLLALAFSTSSNTVLTNPKKIEKWASQSGLYGSFVTTAIEQADKTAGNDQSGGVSLSDAAVKQAAQAAFPSTLIQHNVNMFLGSNYAWLEGKTDKPKFTIDLTDAKTSFAERVGRYVKTYLSKLPVCTAAQEAKIDLSTVDPLTLGCRPSKLDPATEGALVAKQIESNGDFLSNPVITAETFGGKDMEAGTPYYVKYASAPKAYKIGKAIPWIAGAVAILSAIAIYFLTIRRRKGIKVIGITLAVAGAILILTKLASDQIFKSVERQIFDQASIGQLQKSLTGFLRQVEHQLAMVDFWFGVGYLLLAAILIGALIITRQRGLRIPKPLQALTPFDNSAEEEPEEPRPPAPTSAPTPKPRRPKPPRLVQ